MNKIVICFLFSSAFLNLINSRQFEKFVENKDCGDSAVCYSLIEDEKICVNEGYFQDFCFGFGLKSSCLSQFSCRNSICSCEENEFFIPKLNFCVPSKLLFFVEYSFLFFDFLIFYLKDYWGRRRRFIYIR